ncbi:MAG: cytochrome c4 [Betaproteobacteria bacterium]|nr:cytochrome c4 [Betaproteobacteria bacterium]MCC7217858.1 cytochrome c4 [Burkholderiales bacterium]
MDRTSLLAALSLSALVAGAPAAMAQGAGKPDLARAKQIAETVCAACHGADGNSATAVNPNIAGQGAEYISRQLQHFKAGIRVNPIMQGMAAPLTDAEVVALGIYFAQQKGKPLAAKDPTLVATAQTLYRAGDAASGLPACSACHSPNGAGIPRNYPRLSGQHADYTLAQLKAFRAGERGNDKDGKDVQGRVMAAVAQRMTDAQMKALADYAAGLR